MSGNRNTHERKVFRTYHVAMSLSHELIIWNVCDESEDERGGNQTMRGVI